MPEPNLQKLYGYITGTKFDAGKLDIGDYGTFRLKMQQADSRRKLYDVLSQQTVGKKRADFGTFDEFENKVKLLPADQPAVPEGFVPQKPKPQISDIVLKRERQGIGYGDEPLLPLRQGLEKILPPQEAIPDVAIPGVPGTLRTQAGILRGVAGLAEGFTTPENILMTAATAGVGAAPLVAKYGLPVLEGYFAVEAARHVPDLWKAYKEAPETQKPELMTQIVGSLGIAGLAGVGAAKKVGKAAADRALGESLDIDKGILPQEQLPKSKVPFRAPQTKEEFAMLMGEKELAQAKPIAEEITQQAQIDKAKTAVKKIEDESSANLETADLQLKYLSEQSALSEFGKPFDELSVAEKNKAKGLASNEYSRRVRDLSKELDATDETLAGPKNKTARLRQAKELLRQQLVDEKNASKPAEAAPVEVAPVQEAPSPMTEPTGEPPARPALENRMTTQRRALQEDWQAKGVQDGDFLREATPKDVFEQTTGGEWTDTVAAEFESWRAKQGSEFELGDAEVFANERYPRPKVQPAEPKTTKALPAVTQTTTPSVEAHRGEYVGDIPEFKIPEAGRVQERKPAQVPEPEPTPVSKETAPTTPTPETPIQRKARLDKERLDLAERKMAFAKEQQAEKERLAAQRKADQEQKRREALAKKLGSKFGEEKVKLEKEKPKVEKAPAPAETKKASVPETPVAETELKGQPATGTSSITEEAAKPVAPVSETNPQIAKLKPHQQYQQAEALVKDIPIDGDWPANVEKALAGYPANMVEWFKTRKARPSEPFGQHTATTRAGRNETAIEPPPELKGKVDAIADLARKNQIAQSLYEQAQKDLAKAIEESGKGGVQVRLTPKGNYEITVKNPDLLPKHFQDNIKGIKAKEALEGRVAPSEISTGISIHGTPTSEVASRNPLTGSLKDKVDETLRRKQAAANLEKAYNKVKSAYKNDLIDYYFTHGNRAAFRGKTKEGLDVTVDVRHTPSERTLLTSEAAQAEIARQKQLGKNEVELGAKLLESAESQGAWEDAMVAQLGTGVKDRLGDLYNMAKESKENRFADIAKVAKDLVGEKQAQKKRYEFIRTKLSIEDQVGFDTLLGRIKKTDIDIASRLNALPVDLYIRQYKNFAEFGYYVLKSVGNRLTDKAVWTKEMLSSLGAKIDPFLNDLWSTITKDLRNGREADVPQLVPIAGMLRSAFDSNRNKSAAEIYLKTKSEINKAWRQYRKAGVGINEFIKDVLTPKNAHLANVFEFWKKEQFTKTPERSFSYQDSNASSDAKWAADFVVKRYPMLAKNVKDIFYMEQVELANALDNPNIIAYYDAVNNTVYFTDKYPNGRKIERTGIANSIGHELLHNFRNRRNSGKPIELSPEQNVREEKFAERAGKTAAQAYKAQPNIDKLRVSRDRSVKEINRIASDLQKKPSFDFIRRNLSESELNKFDNLLSSIKSLDLQLVDQANLNDFGQVLATTARQYGNYAEFGYWTLKALGKAGANKAAWAAEMVKNLGDRIKPFLDDLWKKINTEGYTPGQAFAETDLPKFNANTVKPKIEKAETPLETVKGAKRPLPFLGAYVEPVIKIIERVSPKLGQGFRQAIDYWENREGEGNALINPLARKLRFKPMALSRLDEISRTEKLKSGEFMWDNWHEWQTKPETKPRDLSGVEQEALDVYNKLLEMRGEKAAQEGFHRVPSFDLLDAIRSENGTVWNTLVKGLAELNGMPEEKVASYLKNYRFDKFAEFPTHIRVGEGKFADTVPVLATQGLSALRALNRDTSRLAGVQHVFGKDYNKTLKEARKALPANFQSDFDLARDAFFGVRRLENSRSMGKRLLLNLAQPIVRTALLARAASQQPTQALAATRLTTGATFARGLADLAKKGTKAELEAIGAYAPSILDLSWQKGQRIEDFGRIASELGGNLSLLKPAIELTDLGIAAAFRRFALDIKERGGKLHPRERNTLEVLNFTPEQINLIDKRGFDGYKDADVLYSALISRGRKAVTFTGLKGPERTKFQLNPLISSLVQFQGFNIGQMQQAAGTVKNLKSVWKSIGEAKTPQEKSMRQAQMISAAKQALILIGATGAAAEANILMKALINGQDPDRPEDAERLWEDLIETGWMPFLREFSYGFASDPSKVMLPMNVGNELVDAFLGRDKYKDYQWWERAAMFINRYATKPYYQPYDLGKNVLVATGLAEGNPTLKTANTYYWDMLRDEGQFKASDREGFDEIQRAMKDVVNMVKDSPYGQLPTETNRRIHETLARALNVKAQRIEAADPEMSLTKVENEAANRIKAGLRARMTVSKLFDDESGMFKIGDKYYNRDELAEKLRGEKYLQSLQVYDSLIQEIIDSL